MSQKRCVDCVPFLLLRDRARAACSQVLFRLCQFVTVEGQSMRNVRQTVV